MLRVSACVCVLVDKDTNSLRHWARALMVPSTLRLQPSSRPQCVVNRSNSRMFNRTHLRSGARSFDRFHVCWRMCLSAVSMIAFAVFLGDLRKQCVRVCACECVRLWATDDEVVRSVSARCEL